MTKQEDCGCRVIMDFGKVRQEGDTLVLPYEVSYRWYCPLHDAAGAMLEALECARDYGFFEDDKWPENTDVINAEVFNAKWGDLDRADVVKRMVDATVAARYKES